MSLAEVLIATAIIAALLVAVAFSFEAMSKSVAINTRYNQAAQTARMGMGRLTEDVRVSEATFIGMTTNAPTMTSTTGSELTLIEPAGRVVHYVFDADERTVRLMVDDPTNPINVVVAREVSNATFSGDVEAHPQTGVYRTVRVTVQLWLNVDGQPLYVSGSAVPRREMVY